MGLRSATNHFEKVIVWTYGTIVFKRGTKDEQFELAKRFEFRDAHDVVPFGTAKQLLNNGASIAHVSDLVRILAASKCTGWIIDSGRAQS